MRMPKKIPKRQTRYMFKAITYIGFSLLCLVNLKQLWAVFLIFIGLSAFYFYEWYKHKDDMSLSEIIKHNLGEDNDIEPNKKEKKKSYQDYLKQIENDFNDEDLDEELANSDDDFDDFSDLYIK